MVCLTFKRRTHHFAALVPRPFQPERSPSWSLYPWLVLGAVFDRQWRQTMHRLYFLWFNLRTASVRIEHMPIYCSVFQKLRSSHLIPMRRSLTIRLEPLVALRMKKRESWWTRSRVTKQCGDDFYWDRTFVLYIWWRCSDNNSFDLWWSSSF